MSDPSRSARLLGLQLAAADPRAVRRVTAAMRLAHGSVRAAAQTLGVTEKTLHAWLRLPALAQAAALRQGRASVGRRIAANRATETRRP